MKYCQSCGSEVDDSAKFCPNCSASLQAQPQTVSPNRRSLHCPQCGSKKISPIVETSVTGATGVHTPITGRVGVSTYNVSNTHRSYWMCSECGHKFRNLENLKEEISRETKRMNMALIWGIIMAVVALLALTSEFMRGFFGVLIFFLIVLAVIFLCIWLSTRSKVQKMCQNRDYLEKHCF